MNLQKNRISLSLVVMAALVSVQIAFAQDCPYWDYEYNQPTMHIGGEAVSSALALLGFAVPADFGCNPSNPECPPTSADDLYYYLSGSTVYVRHWIDGVQQDPIRDLPLDLELPFWLWDFDNNDVPDSVQLELLTELLCLPEGIQHPLVDVEALRQVMVQNEAEYSDLIYQLFSIQTEMEAAWPLFSQRPEIPNGIGWQMRANWSTAGITDPVNMLIDDPLIFASGVIPGPFQETTWNGLAYFLIDIGDAFEMLIEQWNIAEAALNNNASIQLFAAVFAMFEFDVWDMIMNEIIFQSLNQSMYLSMFDWEYLCTKFGITDPSPTDLQNAVDLLDLSPDLMPTYETTAQFDWGTILDDYTGEGEFIDDAVGDTFLTTSARVVQASPDAPAVDICQNGVALFDNLLFKDISAYAEITAPHPDFLYEFAVVPAGDDCSAYVLSDNLDMPNTSTLVALNTYENLEFLVLDDTVTAPVNGTAKLRFVNASPDAGALDVVAGAQTLFANVPFKGVGAFIEVLPGAYTVDFMSAGKEDKALPPADIVLNSGSVYTLYAMGLAENVEVEITEDVEAPDLVAITPPERLAYFAGETFTLSAQVASEASPSAYAWYRDGVLLDGTESTLTIENAGPEDSGHYTVVVTVDVEGVKSITQLSDTTNHIMVYSAPDVTVTGATNVKFGETINLSASLMPFDPIGLTASYMWTKGGDTLSTLPDFSIPYTDDTDADDYILEVIVALADYPEVTRTASTTQAITVTLPAVTISGKSVIEVMDTLKLTATISGTGTTPLEYAYVWTCNTDGNVQVFSETNIMTIENILLDKSGIYKATVALNVAADPSINAVIEATHQVRVTEDELPVGSAFGLTLTISLCALAGASLLKRKK